VSTFFWMLTLIAYTRYAQKRSKVEARGSRADTPVQALDARRSTLDYYLALLFFACGLMSKPMVVTLPFVLLLLDFWPLNRFPPGCSARSLINLIVEKLPFFALTLAASVVTYFVQTSGRALWSPAGLSFSSRVANALWAYERYISKTFWPADLSIFYTHPYHWPAGLVIGAALLLALWSGLFIWRARQNPYLLVGWFWFLEHSSHHRPGAGRFAIHGRPLHVYSQHRSVHHGGMGPGRFFKLASPLAANYDAGRGRGSGGLSGGHSNSTELLAEQH